MALPAGIVLKTVTMGPFTDFSGNPVTGYITFVPSTNLVWAASPGTGILRSGIRVDLSPTGTGAVSLPATDQPGFEDGLANAVTNWTYRVDYALKYTSAGSIDEQPQKVNLLLPMASVDPIDLETVVKVVSSTGILVALPAVLSVAGLTGTVTAQQLIDVIGGGSGGATPDATSTIKGKLALAGDLGGTAAAPTVPGLAGKAPLVSPVFTGIPAADTAAPGTNTAQLATTAFVTAAVVAANSTGPIRRVTASTTLALGDINGYLEGQQRLHGNGCHDPAELRGPIPRRLNDPRRLLHRRRRRPGPRQHRRRFSTDHVGAEPAARTPPNRDQYMAQQVMPAIETGGI